jgi:hypothetical protein
MRIDFEDTSYVEITQTNSGKILLSIGAKSCDDPRKKIINSVELTMSEFKKITAEINY